MNEKTYVIRSWKTGRVIFAFKCRSFKLCVEIAVALNINLDGANLDGANLDGAYLVGANLVGANLAGANLVDAR